MESNKPINKINSNEGIWDGVGYGVAAGLGTAGAIRMAPSVSEAMMKRKFEKLGAKASQFERSTKEWQDLNHQATAFEKKMEGKMNRNNKIRSGYSGWKGAAIAGASALLGGVSGGVIDHYTK